MLRKLRIANESGSMMIMVLMIVALTAMMASAAMTVTGLMHDQASRMNNKAAIDSFTQALETLAADPTVCMGSGGGLGGLSFLPGASTAPASAGKNKFDLVIGDPNDEQNVLLDSNILTVPGDGLLYQNVDLLNGLKIKRLFIKDARVAGPNEYAVKFFHQSEFNGQSFAPRLIGELSLTFAGPLPATLTGCAYKLSAQAICEGMQCKYLPSATKKCVCGFPEMSCPPDGGGHKQYIVGVDTTTTPPTPICRSHWMSCIDKKGPGFALTGVDENGQPICQPFEGNLTAVATPVPGDCGTADGNSYVDATAVNTAGLCNAGTPSPSSVSGPGPTWTWACLGINSGADASCSATVIPSTCDYKSVVFNVSFANPYPGVTGNATFTTPNPGAMNVATMPGNGGTSAAWYTVTIEAPNGAVDTISGLCSRTFPTNSCTNSVSNVIGGINYTATVNHWHSTGFYYNVVVTSPGGMDLCP